jgi:hypothetical protein
MTQAMVIYSRLDPQLQRRGRNLPEPPIARLALGGASPRRQKRDAALKSGFGAIHNADHACLGRYSRLKQRTNVDGRSSRKSYRKTQHFGTSQSGISGTFTGPKVHSGRKESFSGWSLWPISAASKIDGLTVLTSTALASRFPEQAGQKLTTD